MPGPVSRRAAGRGVIAPGATRVREGVWRDKYRLDEDGGREADLDATWRRVARAVAATERAPARDACARRFHRLLACGAFLPGGRIIAGAGSRHRITLFNCFVMGPVEDSLDGILSALHEAAVTLQHGGGGVDFSTLRPAGGPGLETGGLASGRTEER